MTDTSTVSARRGTGSKTKRLVLLGLALAVVGVAVRLAVTDSVGRWRASRLNDQDLARSAADANAPYTVVVEWGRRLEGSGRFAEAERVYARAMDLGPARTEAWNGMGRALVAVGEWSKAEPLLRKEIALWPRESEPRFLLASILGRTFRVNEAISQLSAGLKQEPSGADAWRSLGDLQMQRKNANGAAEAYARALKLAPAAKRAHARLGEALGEAGRYPEAVAELDAELKDNPNDMNTRFAVGKYLALWGKADQRSRAMQELNRVVQFSPNKSRAYYYAARIWFREGDYGNASQALEHAFDVNPANVEILDLLAQTYEKGGRKAEAGKIEKPLATARSLAEKRQWILDAIQGGALLVPNLISLGNTDVEAQNRIEAQSAFEAALLMEPGNAEAARQLKALQKSAK